VPLLMEVACPQTRSRKSRRDAVNKRQPEHTTEHGALNND